MILDSWQTEVLSTEGNIALRSGRQVGKSTCISILAGDYAHKNADKTIMVIASVERQAYLLFEKVLYYLQDTYPKSVVTKGKNKPTKSKLVLANGSRIFCLPTGLTGQGIRGYTIDLLIADEAAFIPDDVFAALTPAIATRISEGARIVLLSTPFGREGYFARAFNDPSFKTFHVSSLDCERIDKNFLEQEKKRMTKRQFQQEYMDEFVDDLMQFFPDTLIRKCMTRQRLGVVKHAYVGIDIARMGVDESVWAIGSLEGEKIIQRENLITTRTRLSDTINTTLQLNRVWDFEKIILDDEGIGVGVSDVLLDNEETRRKIIPVNNSQRLSDYKEDKRVRILKEDLYNNLLVMMEAGNIELLDDPEIFLSLKSVQFDYTTDTKGQVHLKIFGNYTHIAEALIRLAYCRKYKTLNLYILSI